MRVRRAPALSILIALVVSASPAPVLAQRTLEAHLGVGYTAVNRDAWAGVAPWDWNQTSSTGYVQAFLLGSGGLSLGAELGTQRFFWYEVRYTSIAGYTSYTDHVVHATRLMAVARFTAPRGAFVEAGLGPEFFSGFTDYAVVGAAGYMIPAGQRLAIPIKLRGDLVLDRDAKLFPLSVSAGVAYRLK